MERLKLILKSEHYLAEPEKSRAAKWTSFFLDFVWQFHLLVTTVAF